MQRLLLLGLNHTTAPLEVREKVAFSAEQAQAALEVMRGRFPGAEIVLLSTCNRVELYVSRPVHGHPRGEEMAACLGEFHSVSTDLIRPFLYEKHDREAVAHLFSVASSLDSMVLGETQILGQVRDAYELASAARTTGVLMHPLFQRALAVGKQVMSETALNEGRVSVASVAVDHAQRIFNHFNDKTVLCIGAGEMTQIVLRQFAQLAPQRLLVCNRDREKGEALAGQFGGESAPFEFLSEHLASADIVITSTAAAHPIVTRGQFEGIVKQRQHRPIFLIDLAVPRDVEPSVGELESVHLYNLDDLQHAVSSTQSQRSGAIAGAQSIVARNVDEFLAWNRSRELGPVIDRLYKRYHAIAQEEVSRAVARITNLTESEQAHLEGLARRIVNKLLHDPIRALRDSNAAHSAHAPAAAYLHALEKLLRLPEESSDSPEEK